MPDRRAIVAGLLATAAFPAASQGARLHKAVSTIVPLKASPFPYRGKLPDGSGPFLDVDANGRHGHTSPRGGIYWEDETYSDRSTLLAIPKGFDPARPAVIVVFFHGNGATLQRDVVGRQRVVAQVEASGLNAVLVAPQFARDAQDSSAGNFWTPGYFAKFMAEAAQGLATLTGAKAAKFEAMPVVMVAYSGGYNPAASVLGNGDIGRRLLGVILLDAVFDEAGIFADWIAHHRKSFFVSAYGKSSASGNAEIRRLLAGHGIDASSDPPRRLEAGTVALLASDAAHDTFVTRAFVGNPLQWLLARLHGFAR
ncbi:hypothetical protein FJ434_21280 [Mesorhizobium sp. B2-5-13]|uniref:hypothetical protein n=1 Tax=unclassified Mesorhizobium TaxID=325217 RepID=UPI001128A016|nr:MULTISPECIES: hypothetical protein [unclassified Mesorhizobium]TPJ39606.1 hypothetical protein FJ432_18805 [Mesorhizobium sp. B2-6-5]TPJ81593.1 hypothetical protein FJ434_21280 [Mesorhizobium sp. B2-5-13]TPK45630.1 hypothetical protein FJ560_20750 [Mesorhizobium sp. B2-5-5]